MKTKIDSMFAFLEHCGGAEMFSFYRMDAKGNYILDHNGKHIPDVDEAYRFGNELKDQFTDYLDDSIEIHISTNIVRIRLLNQVPV